MSRKEHLMSRKGRFMWRKGRFMWRKGHFMSRKGRFMSRKGRFMSRKGHFMSRKGRFMSRKGHFMSRKGRFMSRKGHFMSRKGHFKSRKGHFMKFPMSLESLCIVVQVDIYDSVSALALFLIFHQISVVLIKKERMKLLLDNFYYRSNVYCPVLLLICFIIKLGSVHTNAFSHENAYI